MLGYLSGWLSLPTPSAPNLYLRMYIYNVFCCLAMTKTLEHEGSEDCLPLFPFFL